MAAAALSNALIHIEMLSLKSLSILTLADNRKKGAGWMPELGLVDDSLVSNSLDLRDLQLSLQVG